MENHDVNENPIIAAGGSLSGGNSRLARSLRVRKQLRDSKGRWIYMGGNLGLKFKLADGTNIRVYGKNVGASEAKEGFAQVYIQNSGNPAIPDGFYLAKGDKGRVYKDILTKEELAKQGIELKDVSDTDPELQPIADLIPIDAPEGWEKRADGSYRTPDGDYVIAKNESGQWELLQDEIPLGAHDNIGDAFGQAADIDAEASLNDDEKSKIADLRSKQDKLNEDFAKTTNPDALARIEKKLEVVDGGIKDILRNKPADAPTAEEVKTVDGHKVGTKARATFTPSAPGAEKSTSTWTLQEDGTWKNDKTGMVTDKLPSEWTPEDGFGKGAWSKTTFEEPKDATPAGNGEDQTPPNEPPVAQLPGKEPLPGEKGHYTEDPAEMQQSIDAAPVGSKFKTSANVAYESMSGPNSKFVEERGDIELVKGPDGGLYSNDESDQEYGYGYKLQESDIQGLEYLELTEVGSGVKPSPALANGWTEDSTDTNGNKILVSPDGKNKITETLTWKNDYSYTLDGDTKKYTWTGVQKNLPEAPVETPTPMEQVDTLSAPITLEVGDNLFDIAATSDDLIDALDLLPAGTSISLAHQEDNISIVKNEDGSWGKGTEKYGSEDLAQAADPASPNNPMSGWNSATIESIPAEVKNLDDYKLVEGAKGSNKGGVYEGPDGDRVYVKFQDEAHANNEILASKLYDLAGVPAADVRKATMNGDTVTYTPMIETTGTLNGFKNDPEFLANAQDGFAVDAWLANWDVAGLNNDNIVADQFGSPVRIDAGGALEFRAQGAPKGDAFGDKATEVESLLDPNVNKQSADLFGSMTDAQKSDSAGLISDITDQQITDTVQSVLGDTPEAKAMADKLIARRDDVLAKLQPAPSTAPSVDEIANTPFGEDINTWEADLAKAMEQIDNAPSEDIAFPVAGDNYFKWEKWAFNTKPGTKAYQKGADGSVYEITRNDGEGWTAKNLSTGAELQLTSNQVTSLGAQGNLSDTPLEATPAVETPAGNLEVFVDEGLTTLYNPANGSDLGNIIQVPGGKFDAEFMMFDAEKAAKATFDSKEDAQAWLGDLAAAELNLETNPFNGNPAGQFDKKVTVHKKGFLKPASAAQIEAVKGYLVSKDLTPEEVADIQNTLAKDNLVGGEIGSLIGMLKQKANKPDATLTPKADGTADVPVIDDPQVNPKVAQDVLDANIIWNQIKVDHPDHTLLSESDMLIQKREITNAYGHKITYEVIVRRTKTERFFAYVRETNEKKGTVRVMKATPEVHSYKALANKMAAVKFHIATDEKPSNWMNKSKKPIVTVPDGIDVTQHNDSMVATFSFPKSTEANKQALVDAVTELVNNDASINKGIVDAFATAMQVDPAFSNELFDAVVNHQFKKASGAAIMPTEDAPTPYVSFDGVTEVNAGDYVDWTDNKIGSPTYGQVFRGVVQGRMSYHESKKYGYTDAVLVIFPEYNKIHGVAPSKQRVRTAPGLIVVDKNAEMSAPFKQKVKEKADQDKIVKLTSDLPDTKSADSAAITPKPKTARQVATENATVPADAPQSKKEVASLAVEGNGLSLTAAQLQNGDIIKVTPNGGTTPIDGFVHTVSSSNGITTVNYSYFTEGKSLPNMGKLQMSDGKASTIKMAVIRPGAVNAPEASAPENNIPEGNAPESTLDTKVEAAITVANNLPADTDPVIAQEVQDAAAQAVMTSQDAAPQEEAFGGYIVQKLEPEDIKYSKNVKSHRFENVKKVYGKNLEVGDLIPQGTTGYNKHYRQVIDIDPEGGKWGGPLITYRVVGNGTNHGTIGTMSPSYSYNNVKRPKNIPANVEYVKQLSGGDINNGSPLTQKADSSLKTVDSLAEINLKAVEAHSSAQFDAMGINTEVAPGVSAAQVGGYHNSPENLFKTAATPYQMPAGINQNYNVMPGQVVQSLDRGSAGVITSLDKENGVVTVSWLSGAKAGYTEQLSNTSIRTTKNILTSDNAKEFGVEIDTTPEVEIKKAVAEAVDNLKVQYADKIAQEQAIAEYNAMKDKNTVSGPGSERVVITEDLNWDHKAFDGINSLNEALETVQSGASGTFGRQVLVDSDEIEDNKVRVSQVVDVNGKKKTRLQFVVTDWSSNGEDGITGKAKTAEGATSSNGIKYPTFKDVYGTNGILESNGQTVGNKGGTSTMGIDKNQNGTTYNVPITSPTGEVIGYYLLHRANKGTDPVNFGISNTQNSDKALSYHNKVDVYLDENASSADIEYALSQIGISAARPATKADVQLMAENKIIDLFGDKKNGAKNYSGELRAKVLADFEAKYGVSAADAEFVQEGSDLYLLLPEEFGNAVAKSEGVNAFRHGWTFSSEYSTWTQDQKADFIYKFLTNTGVRPTSARWAQGINATGASSNTDGYGHGANYVFTRPGGSSGGGTMSMTFNAASLLRRLDYYANFGDGWGVKKPLGPGAKLKDTGEVMFKDGISWADLASISISNPELRQKVLDLLLAGGHDTIGGKPINEVIQ